jgi:hypothetical protein
MGCPSFYLIFILLIVDCPQWRYGSDVCCWCFPSKGDSSSNRDHEPLGFTSTKQIPGFQIIRSGYWERFGWT